MWASSPNRSASAGSAPATHLAEADEVGVEVEDEQAEPGLEEQPLEQDAERIRLARAGLAAEERVAREAAGVEPCRYSLDRGLADLELGAGGRQAAEQRVHLGGRGGAHVRVAKRGCASTEDDACAGRQPHARGRSNRRRPVVGVVAELQLGAFPLLERPSCDLAEKRLAVRLERRIAADTEVRANRRVVDERAAVERGRERQNRLLESPAKLPVALELATDAGGIGGGIDRHCGDSYPVGGGGGRERHGPRSCGPSSRSRASRSSS